MKRERIIPINNMKNDENVEILKERKTKVNKKIKEEQGITLIVLVITMIILIILSTVTISTVLGDNGLIKQAKDSKDSAINSIEKENEDLNELEQEYANVMGEDGGESPGPEEDKIPPTINGIITSNITENSITVTVNATDNSGVIASYKYYINGTEKTTSSSNSYKYEGLTAGTSYTIRVEAYDKAGNMGEKTITASTNKKPGDGAGEINKNPSAYYGAEVRGYTCDSKGVSKWRIFYADSTNIYLIADDYISYQYAPDGRLGSSIYKNGKDWELSFRDVEEDYGSAEWISTNSKGSKWLNKFLSRYPLSNSWAVKSVAYMMDTNVWSTYAGADAEYAMGGPTIEMFCESYKDTHPTEYIECEEINSYGYQVRWYDGSLAFAISDLVVDDFNKIYIKSDESKAGGMWLASPSAYGGTYVMSLGSGGISGSVSYDHNSDGKLGLRPIVCLKSTVQLEKVEEGVYQIVK